jgi:hypothetical protein
MRGCLFLLALCASAQTFRVHTLPFTCVNGEGSRKYMPGTMAGGVAAFDFDGDGLMDLFFPNGAALPSLAKQGPQHYHRLYRNRGGFQFEDVTAQSGITQDGYGMGAVAGDIDGDSQPDLVLLGVGFIRVYRNLGGGKFQETRLANQGQWAYAAALEDFDQDGDRDLFVVNYAGWDAARDPPCKVAGVADYCHPRYYPPRPNHLFENDGRGNFRDVTAASGLAKHLGKGMGLAVADFNADGRLDVFVTNDRELNFLFLNEGKLRFREDAFGWGVAVPADGRSPSAMGAAAADFNGDGKPDLIYTALKDETFPVYRNTGKDFADAARETGLGRLTRSFSGWAVLWEDFNRDGRRDLFFARSDALSPTGGRGEAAKEPLTLLTLGADGKYSEAPAIPAAPAMYRWAAAADFNRDGCLDIVVTALNSPALLLENLCSVP